MRWLLLVALAGCGVSAQERANMEMQCHSMPCPYLKTSILLPKGSVLVCQCVDDYNAMGEARRR